MARTQFVTKVWIEEGCTVCDVCAAIAPDIFEVHEKVGDRFCISGGIPNDLLAFGTPDELRDCCRKVIEGVAGDGGYIMDASAIMQDDTKVENLRAMTEAMSFWLNWL